MSVTYCTNLGLIDCFTKRHRAPLALSYKVMYTVVGGIKCGTKLPYSICVDCGDFGTQISRMNADK